MGIVGNIIRSERRWMCLSLLLVSCLFSSVIQAATKPPEPEIDVAFDRQAFIAGEPFQVQISISTEGEGEPRISLPSFNGMKVLKKNVTRPTSGYSFSFSFGSGQNTRRVVQNSGVTRYDIVLMADKAGTYNIGPVKVVLDGYTFNGKNYPIEVFDRGSASAALPPSQAGSSEPVASDDLTDAQLADARIDPDYFLHMIPSKTECVQGEQIVLDVYLFTSVGNIRADQFEREPGTEGFWAERFEDFDLRNQRNRQVVINDTLYEQVLLKKLALFPLKSGKLTIAPPVFSFVVGGGGFFSFSRGKKVKRAASPVIIDVAPLPEKGRPKDFADANVGTFSFLVDAGETEVKVGEPVTVTVNVRGNGNIRSVVLPTFGEVDGFKAYAPETDVEVQARGGVVSGVSQSRTLFIPEKEGKLTIPSLTFSWFDLQSGQYQTRTSDPITVTVSGGNQRDSGKMVDSRSDTRTSTDQVSAPVERMNAQMRTIVNGVDTHKIGTPMFARWWYTGLVFGVPVIFALYLLITGLRKRAAESFLRGRSRRAEADAKKSLTQLDREKNLTNDQFFSRLHKILLTFLEDRLEENVVGDTMNQLGQRLVDRGFDETHVRQVINALEEYEFARFARSGSNESERKGDVQRAVTLISSLGSVQITALSENRGGQS
jgi:hypothetical protein